MYEEPIYTFDRDCFYYPNNAITYIMDDFGNAISPKDHYMHEGYFQVF